MSFSEKLERDGIIFVGDIREEGMTRAKGIVASALNRGKKVTLLIDSSGGNCEQGQWFIDQMGIMGINARGIVVGKCSSMAIPLLLACEKRIAVPSARFFFHEVRSSNLSYRAGESLGVVSKRLRTCFNETRRMQRSYNRFCAERMGVEVRTIEKLVREGERDDKFIYADEAKRLGIIHEVTRRSLLNVKDVITEYSVK